MRLLRLFAPLLAAVLLASCGSSGGSGAGNGSAAGAEKTLRPLVLAAVRTNTEAAETARTLVVIRMEIRGVPDQADESFELRAEGAVDLTNERARFIVEVPEGMDEGTLPFTGELEFVVDGAVAYLRVPEGESVDGKQWVRMPVDGGLDANAGMGFGMLGSAFDPSLALDILGFGEPTVVEAIGREEVRGDSTIHYRVAATPAGVGEGAHGGAGFLQMFGGSGPFVYDVWVDDEQRLRKLTYSIDLADMFRGMFAAFGAMAAEMGGGGAGEEGGEAFPTDMTMLMETEMEVWAFGDGVEIEVPSPDQVADGAPHGFEP